MKLIAINQLGMAGAMLVTGYKDDGTPILLRETHWVNPGEPFDIADSDGHRFIAEGAACWPGSVEAIELAARLAAQPDRLL